MDRKSPKETRKERERDREHLCNAIRLVAKRYVEVVNWTKFIHDYRRNCGFDSRYHTVLEQFYHGIGHQLMGLMVQMAGYDFASDVEAASSSDVPDLRIEASLERLGFKKGKKLKCRVRKST